MINKELVGGFCHCCAEISYLFFFFLLLQESWWYMRVALVFSFYCFQEHNSIFPQIKLKNIYISLSSILLQPIQKGAMAVIR